MMRPDMDLVRPQLPQFGQEFLAVFHVSEIRLVVAKISPDRAQLPLRPGGIDLNSHSKWRRLIRGQERWRSKALDEQDTDRSETGAIHCSSLARGSGDCNPVGTPDSCLNGQG